MAEEHHAKITIQDYADASVLVMERGHDDKEVWQVILSLVLWDRIEDPPPDFYAVLGSFDTEEEAKAYQQVIAHKVKHIIRFALNAARDGRLVRGDILDTGFVAQMRKNLGRTCQNCLYWQRDGESAKGFCSATGERETLLRLEVSPGATGRLVSPEDFWCAQFEQSIT